MAREYKEEIELVPFRFDSLDDIPAILDRNREAFSNWLFPDPYRFT